MENIRVNPFETGAEEYDSWYSENGELYRSELDAVKALFPDDGNNIEIGVGTGVFASKLGIVTGVEPAEEMAKIAEARGIEVIRSVAESLPIGDGIYDAALMATVECFLSDVTGSFREIYRILKEDGIFVIAFLDLASPLGKVYEENKNFDKNYKHATFHTADEIRGYLCDAGFTPAEEVQTVFELGNVYQPARPGTGEGVFAVIKAVKK